jgi:hypothetical protein
MKPMTGKQIKRFATDEQLRKRLAKLIVQQCFRNTEIENVHAEGKISQSDMRRIMVDSVNKTYTNLTMLLGSAELTDRLIELLSIQDMVSYWDEPVCQPVTLPGDSPAN